MEVFLPIAEVQINIVLFLFVSFAIGFLSGLFGVGGGFLMTPFLIFMGIPPAYAVANEANNILASSTSGSLTHWFKKTMDLKMGWMIIGGGLIGTALGMITFGYFKGINKIDLVITLGGDGTTLRAFRNLQNETPILTINVGGNRGILSEITLDEFDKALDSILKNKIWLDKRTRVVATCNDEEFAPALNEIYINRKNLTKTAEFEIKFQNDTVKQKMDGVIVSTPSGSTGHSFSIGGPLLHESLDVLIITPVAPVHRLPSIVVPDQKVEINCSHDCNIVMDAQMIRSAGVGEKIIIKKFKKQAVFVRLRKKGLRQMNKLGF